MSYFKPISPVESFLFKSVRTITFFLSCLSAILFSVGNATGGETSVPRKAEKSPISVPFLLHQNSYSGTTAEIVQLAISHWRFDGVELSMTSMLKESGNENLDEFLRATNTRLEKLGVRRESSFQLHLSIDGDLAAESGIQNVVSILKSLPISSYSIVASRKIEWMKLAKELQSRYPHLPAMIENGDICSGIDIGDLVEESCRSPLKCGVLLNSNGVKYRFDLAMQDFQIAIAKDEYLPCAFRFECSTDELSTSEKAEFTREMFRRGIAQQLELSRPLFVSIKSSNLLKWQERDGGQFGLGSKVFRDMILSIRKELATTSVVRHSTASVKPQTLKSNELQPQ